MDRRRPAEEANQHVALDIDEWLEAIKGRAGRCLQSKPPAWPTIFRVPRSMRCGNRRAYEPELVSIGPYHHGKSKDLKATEKLKWRLLHNYLSNVPNGRMNEGLRELIGLEEPARDCYSEQINMDKSEFVEMLLLDGCFLVQIFITLTDNALEVEELTSLLFHNTWFPDLIFRDMLLLENQLPYFVINHLLDMLMLPGWDSSRFQNEIITCFSGFLPGQYLNSEQQQMPHIVVDHLLDLFHQWISSFLKLQEEVNISSLSEEEFEKPVPCMTELAEAGVKIKVMREAKSFLDISFRNGVLRIPAISISDETNFVFSNLIALEQCSSRHRSVITEYTSFMDDIINSSRDVQLLHEEGIIHRYLGDDRDIASLFNKLCIGARPTSEINYLNAVYKELHVHCKSRWHTWRAKAVHDYFNNPWAIISLGAAILLLGLTILQSVYTIYDHYKK